MSVSRRRRSVCQLMAVFAVLVAVLVQSSVVTAASASNSESVGVTGDGEAMAMAAKAGGVFDCADGSATIDAAFVEDDYCDCPDGSDERTTSACGHTNNKFTCANAGFLETFIPTTLVNDGICDCCDGSDEPAGVCPDTCRLAGDRLRDGAGAALQATISGLFFKRRDLKVAKAHVEKFKQDLFQAVQEDEALKLLASLVKDRLNREEIEEYRERVERGRQALQDGGGFGKSHSGGLVPDTPEDIMRSRLGGIADELEVQVEDYDEYDYGGYEDRFAYGEDGELLTADPDDADDAASSSSPSGVQVVDDGGDGDGGDDDGEDYDDVLTPPPKKQESTHLSADDFACKRLLQSTLLTLHDRPMLKDFLASSIDRDMVRPTDVPADPRKIVPIRPDPDQAPDVDVVEQRKKGIFGGLFYAEDPLKMTIHYLLRTVGFIVSPIRALWDLLGIVLYGCGVGVSAVCRVVPIDAVSSAPETAVSVWNAIGQGVYDLYLSLNEATGGALAEIEWKLTEWKIWDGLSVVWGTGSVIYYAVFPPQDWDFIRPEAEEMRDWDARITRELESSAKRLDSLRDKADAEAMFGDDVAYLALMDHCFELKTHPYTYKLCPFKDAKQDWTSLGKHEGWLDSWPAVDIDGLGTINQTMLDAIQGVEPGKSILRGKAMTFRDGQQCWSGPKRQVDVYFYCGNKTEVTHVSEPSTCQYDMHVSTTAACSVDIGRYLKAQLSNLGMTSAEIAAVTKSSAP